MGGVFQIPMQIYPVIVGIPKYFGSDDETCFYKRENDMTLSQFDFGSWDAHSG